MPVKRSFKSTNFSTLNVCILKSTTFIHDKFFLDEFTSYNNIDRSPYILFMGTCKTQILEAYICWIIEKDICCKLPLASNSILYLPNYLVACDSLVLSMHFFSVVSFADLDAAIAKHLYSLQHCKILHLVCNTLTFNFDI